MTADEYRQALAGLSAEQFQRFRASWGGTKDTVEKCVAEFAYAANPEQWDQIAVHCLREVGVGGVKTEKEKLAEAASSSVASARVSAQAAERSAVAAASSARSTRWGVGVSVAAAIVAGLGVWNQWGPRTEPPPAFLTADEACELLVSKELHQLFDGWAMRFQFVVWCNRNGQGDVAVTITPANGQEGRIDPALMKSQVEAEVGRVLARKGWEARLRQVSVQVLP